MRIKLFQNVSGKHIALFFFFGTSFQIFLLLNLLRKYLMREENLKLKLNRK